LKDGILSDIQIPICPGTLPTGSTCEATKKSTESHQYPLPKDPKSNFPQILIDIIEFLMDDFRELPIFFTEGGTENIIDQRQLIYTQRALKAIFEEAGEYSLALKLKVFPFTFLAYYLNQIIEQQQTADSDENDKGHHKTIEEIHKELEFATSDFAITSKSCDFHDTMDAKQFCCLTKVRRFGYGMAKLFADTLKYPLIEGQHFPKGYSIFMK
jgi:hypothetical protein